MTQRICHSRLRRSEGRQGCQPGGATLVASSSIVHTRRQPMHPDSLVDTPGFWPLPHARCPTVRPGRPTPAAYAHHSSAKLHARNGCAARGKWTNLGKALVAAAHRGAQTLVSEPILRPGARDLKLRGLGRGYQWATCRLPRLLGPRNARASPSPPSDDRCLRRALTGREAHGGRWRRAATLLTQWKVAHIPTLTTTP